MIGTMNPFMVRPRGLMVMEGGPSWARWPPSTVAPRRGQPPLTVNGGGAGQRWSTTWIAMPSSPAARSTTRPTLASRPNHNCSPNARPAAFRDQPARPAVPGRDDRRLVQEGAGIVDSEDLGVGMTDAVACGGAESIE
jgi:hypothetical protein